MKLRVDRDALAKMFRPWADKLVTELAAVIGPQLDELLAQARGEAMAGIARVFAPPAPPVEIVAPRPKRAASSKRKVIQRDPKPEKVILAPTAPEPIAKPPRKCTACQRPGHRADRCPDREQPAPIMNATPAIVNEAPQKASASPPIAITCHHGSLRTNPGRSPCALRARGQRMTPTRKANLWLAS